MASIKRKLIRHIDYNMKKNSKNYNYAIYENDSFKNIEDTMIEMETSKLNKHLMDTCLLKLSKRQRQAIHLKYFNNLDTVQISNTMKINQQSVYNLIFGALKSLKTTLGTDFECQC